MTLANEEKDSRGYRITMPPEAYDALQELAQTQNRPMANVIREALEQYLKAHGYSVSFQVNRGGKRPSKPD